MKNPNLDVLDNEVERLLALPIEELLPELKKKTNVELAGLGYHSSTLCTKLSGHLKVCKACTKLQTEVKGK